MKRIFTFLLLIYLSVFSAFSAEQATTYTAADSVRFILSIVLKNTQMDFEYNEYPLLVHLYDKFQPDSLQVYPDQYLKKQKDFYYKRAFLYSKIINKQAVVTSDCLHEEESGKWHPLRKLLFQSMYEGPTWNFPKDYVQQLEQYSAEDIFYGPVISLIDIYFLKQYNWNKLSASDKSGIKDLEKRLAASLNKNYIENKEWGYHRLYALWAIRINKLSVADEVDINELTRYFDWSYWMVRFPKDYENEVLMKREGGQYTTYMSNLCTFWLFTLNKSG